MNEFQVTLASIAMQVMLKLVCFFLGYLTIRLGYKLISDGIKGRFEFSAGYKDLKGGLISSSPGLLFVLLGCILIGYAMYLPKTVSLETNVHDIPPNITLPNETQKNNIIDSIN